MKFDQTEEKIQSKRDHSNFTENEKNKNGGCHVLSCRNGGGVTADGPKCKEEVERYSKDKYQDEEMINESAERT